MAKTTKRAKRLTEYLEDVLGWTVFNENYVCANIECMKQYYHRANFCENCGYSLINKSRKDSAVLQDVEMAIKYAIKKS